ncbi:hypothetical protein BJ508DRAFT_329010 [Ascobolus immersus RN42]|uniref:Uncharacterized protein n=1 Tax=Ascobolus immersus RN42 TaxID=1160509 RepID=A0A3N4I3L1_ASCIM|nr:hypothetical protein BJ508DRAFT_329010 [Ascobolus immersus RN42]
MDQNKQSPDALTNALHRSGSKRSLAIAENGSPMPVQSNDNKENNNPSFHGTQSPNPKRIRRFPGLSKSETVNQEGTSSDEDNLTDATDIESTTDDEDLIAEEGSVVTEQLDPKVEGTAEADDGSDGDSSDGEPHEDDQDSEQTDEFGGAITLPPDPSLLVEEDDWNISQYPLSLNLSTFPTLPDVIIDESSDEWPYVDLWFIDCPTFEQVRSGYISRQSLHSHPSARIEFENWIRDTNPTQADVCQRSNLHFGAINAEWQRDFNVSYAQNYLPLERQHVVLELRRDHLGRSNVAILSRLRPTSTGFRRVFGFMNQEDDDNFYSLSAILTLSGTSHVIYGYIVPGDCNTTHEQIVYPTSHIERGGRTDLSIEEGKALGFRIVPTRIKYKVHWGTICPVDMAVDRVYGSDQDDNDDNEENIGKKDEEENDIEGTGYTEANDHE